MLKIKNLSKLEKIFININLILGVFFHFIPMLFKRKISLWRYIQFSRRLLYFLSILNHNKFVKIGKKTKFELYAPAYPSKAFYYSCEKFLEFDKTMPPVTALISITSACKFNCEHCYQKHDKGKDADIKTLVKTIKKLQNNGVAFFNIEGGDPFLVWDRLKAVCEAIDDRAEIWINSTGDGITKERLLELKKYPVTSIMFSLRTDSPEKFDQLMGRKNSWQITEKAIKLCHEVNIPISANSCLAKEDFYNGNFEKVMEKAKNLGVSIIQIIHPKPAGGWIETGADHFEEKDLKQVKKLVDKYNLSKKYANYPSISSQALEEAENRFGCTAGGIDRFYINAKGDLQPCEFLNISFGNIQTDDFDEIYNKMRKEFTPASSSWICEKYSKEVFKIMKENKLTSLPLSPELSKQIYKNWNRGNKTKFYDKIEKMK